MPSIFINKKEVKMKSTKWLGVILALLVIIFALWETTYSQWIIVIAGVLLLIIPFLKKRSQQEQPKARPRKRR